MPWATMEKAMHDAQLALPQGSHRQGLHGSQTAAAVSGAVTAAQKRPWEP